MNINYSINSLWEWPTSLFRSLPIYMKIWMTVSAKAPYSKISTNHLAEGDAIVEL
jgi:hypothetical protein